MADIINYIDKLPWHPTKRWVKRDVKSIKKIIIHQTASKAYPYGPKDVENINKYFITPGNHISETGCPHFCYHYAVDDDGKIYVCNDLTDITWHAKGFNTVSLGIAVIGSFDGPTFVGKDHNPTDKQITSLIEFLDGFILNPFGLYNLQKSDVYLHSNLDKINKQSCPGFKISEIVEKWRTS